MIEIVTKAELSELRTEILEKLEQIARHTCATSPEVKPYLRSAEVKRLLGISHGKLQQMRDRGQIKFTRVDGTLFYRASDIDALLKNK